MGRIVTKIWLAQYAKYWPASNETFCHNNIPCQVMSQCELDTLIICVGLQRSDFMNFETICSKVDWVKIWQGWGMSWWQLDTLMICIGFWRRDVLDLEMLFLEVDWVIVSILSSSTAYRPSIITIFQGKGMSWCKWSILVSYVGFWKLDGSDLKGLFLDVDLVITKIPSSSTSL